MYKRAKEILNIFNVTVKEVKELTDSVKGVLKIGASSTIGEYILPKFISEFYLKYPEINIEVLIDNTYGIATKLKNMNLDIGIIEGSVASAYFSQEYFLDDKMVLAVPYDSTIEKSNLNINDLQNKNWVAREYGS
ncbi:LysR family transcriptional regulator, partial [Clostridium saudiense]|nr:LysR family transcriptional regulator [Clostridium saudiense]